MLACNRGCVMDLSTGGMRLLAKRRLRGKVPISIWDRHRGVKLTGTVVWSKRIGFRQWMIGLSFGELDASTRRDLATLAADNRVSSDTFIAA